MRAFFGVLFIGMALCQGGGNPFEGHDFYVNPSYQKELSTSIATATGKAKAVMQDMLQISSAYWVDVKAKITGTNTSSVQGILMDAAKKSPPQLVLFIVYDLPNRDCDAKASNGEICCYANADGTCNYDKTGNCAEGITEYKTTYIDPFAEVLKKYAGNVPLVLLIEPDSLGNLATNMGHPHCGNSATVASYEAGIPYAIDTLSAAAPHAALYLDACHGGWLGWSDNLGKYKTVVQNMGVLNKLRGFATNVANYQPTGEMCPWDPDSSGRNNYCLNGQHQTNICCKDPCKLEGQWDAGNNEMNYVNELYHTFGASYHYIIDTGRNGVGDMRSDCSNWCNPRGAGIGAKPTTKTINTTIIDAYFWLKTPGESDGCTQTLPDGSQCARYDSMCGSVDSIGSKSGEPKVPEAGKWFDYQIKQLAANCEWDPTGWVSEED